MSYDIIGVVCRPAKMLLTQSILFRLPHSLAFCLQLVAFEYIRKTEKHHEFVAASRCSGQLSRFVCEYTHFFTDDIAIVPNTMPLMPSHLNVLTKIILQNKRSEKEEEKTQLQQTTKVTNE